MVLRRRGAGSSESAAGGNRTRHAKDRQSAGATGRGIFLGRATGLKEMAV